MNIKIYGASDDLIEIEGDIREEICQSLMDTGYLALSDGTLLKVTYDGDWTFRVIFQGPGTKIVIAGIPPNQDAIYSEEVHIESDRLVWAVYGNGFVK